jgi:Short C-terminal domain
MKMRKIMLIVLLAIAPHYALGDTQTKLVRTGEIVPIPYKLSLKEIEDAILDGSVRRGWEPKKLSDGTIEDTLHIRSHIAVVHVVYTKESFRIDYADSTNLTSSAKYGGASRYQIAQNTSGLAIVNSAVKPEADGEMIHKNYYVWTQNLASYIKQSLEEAKKKSETSNSKPDNESVPNKLRALEALRKEGVISAEEYQQKKKQLLDQF